MIRNRVRRRRTRCAWNAREGGGLASKAPRAYDAHDVPLAMELLIRGGAGATEQRVTNAQRHVTPPRVRALYLILASPTRHIDI